MFLEVLDRSANQPAGSLGDLGQPCLVLFFEAAEVTEAVKCHHRLHCGPVKQFQQLGADVEGLQPLREVQLPVTFLQEVQNTQEVKRTLLNRTKQDKICKVSTNLLFQATYNI